MTMLTDDIHDETPTSEMPTRRSRPPMVPMVPMVTGAQRTPKRSAFTRSDLIMVGAVVLCCAIVTVVVAYTVAIWMSL